MGNDKIAVSAVSYLNTKPFLYGLFKSPVADLIDLQLDMPSVCAEKLTRGEARLGLVPVAVIPHLEKAQLVSNYCIGCEGAVRTVCVYADQPLESLETLYLDYQSRTSVRLLQILLDDHWQRKITLLPAKPGFEARIGGKTGALVIGDRCIELEKRHEYRYDLGEAWYEHTGLPFVFAAWVATRPLHPDFEKAFNEALKKGIEDIPQLVYILPQPAAHFDLKEYLTRNIQYHLDEPKREALGKFLRALAPEKEIIQI